MSLLKCKECGADISDQAATCPNCGAPQIDAKEGKQDDYNHDSAQQITAAEGIKISRTTLYLVSTIVIIACSLFIIQSFGDEAMNVVQILFILAALLNLIPQIQNTKEFVERHRIKFLINSTLQSALSVFLAAGAIFNLVVYISDEEPLVLPLFFLLASVINLISHWGTIKGWLLHLKNKTTEFIAKTRNKTAENGGQLPNRSKLIIGVSVLAAVVLGFFVFGGGHSLSGDDYDDASISGTYYWTDGHITHEVDIYGDSWYGVTKFGRYGDEKTESGTVRGNKLYLDDVPFWALGSVSGNRLHWGTHTLTKQ